MDRFDVVVVGMGPVGATIACLLGRAGLSVAVLDRELAIFDKPRAIVLDHEALRILQFCGVNEAFFRSVSPHTGTDFVGVQRQLIKLFDPKAPPFELGWPPNVMFIQPELENALADAMDRLPGIVRHRGWTVTAIHQSVDEAIVDVTDENGHARQLTTAWVIGADGANSTVRQAAALPLDDMDFAEWWVVVDAWLTADTELPRKTTQYCQPARPATFVVGPGKLRRWEIKLLPGEDPDAFRDEDRIRELLANFVDVDALSLWRSAVYRFRAVVARRWRDRRLLIAGDAAHTMPPFLAQGLCAGMRDAGNLAWKLVQVVREGGDPALLDTYEEERKPHVAEIIGHAKAFGLIIGELDPARAEQRDKALVEQLRSGAVPTERQAFVPALRHGLIDADAIGAGTLFVQPRIQVQDGREVLMDDAISNDFLIVASDPAILDIDSRLAERWSRIGGLMLVVGDEAPAKDGVTALCEIDGMIAGWLRRMGAAAVIVRPDRYIYGAAADAAHLARMVESIATALEPRQCEAAI